MESTEGEITIVAYVQKIGWCVLLIPNYEIACGPYDTHKEARQAAERRAGRLNRGWAP